MLSSQSLRVHVCVNTWHRTPSLLQCLFMYEDFLIVLFSTEREKKKSQKTQPFISLESSHKPSSCNKVFLPLSSESFQFSNHYLAKICVPVAHSTFPSKFPYFFWFFWEVKMIESGVRESKNIGLRDRTIRMIVFCLENG